MWIPKEPKKIPSKPAAILDFGFAVELEEFVFSTLVASTSTVPSLLFFWHSSQTSVSLSLPQYGRSEDYQSDN